MDDTYVNTAGRECRDMGGIRLAIQRVNAVITSPTSYNHVMCSLDEYESLTSQSDPSKCDKMCDDLGGGAWGSQICGDFADYYNGWAVYNINIT